MSQRSPNNQYQLLIDSHEIDVDKSQHEAVEYLQKLYVALTAKSAWFQHKRRSLKGLYLWGKVGRGKTFLMDLFVASLPKKVCKRQHFHHFMQDVHQQLNYCVGRTEPLKYVAQQFSKQHRVLCFDEFFVTDIGDAMLLGNLLKYLFEFGVVVVCTSNCAPQALYRNGLQRARFLPAITAIEQHTDILHLDGEKDHRKRVLTYAKNYIELPCDQAQQHNIHNALLKQFGLHTAPQNTVPQRENRNNKITILGRDIHYIAQLRDGKKNIICFEFSTLCQGPRSHFDYVELANIFDTILLFNVPNMSGAANETIKARGTEDNGSNINIAASETGQREVMLAPLDDAARRFIALIDECYDRHITVVITAHVAQAKLYNSGTLLFEFERAKSRLIEMSTVEYQHKRSASPYL
ncbi:cell division protein ZapE [Thalassotalea sediminis]|uniref:cell division protein ZapE n=1 Tax=Thalassotalea sediminis TaxID=1759089 RepID=UPI0025727846|nr:cell division protein ZapE [Thalassotalea sediminis]